MSQHTAYGDNPHVHAIREGRFVCTAPAEAKCRNYPNCACEVWDDEHCNPTEPGDHRPVPQDKCWIEPWIEAGHLCDTYDPEETAADDGDFPDGPVTVYFHGDYVTWAYADGSNPLMEDDR